MFAAMPKCGSRSLKTLGLLGELPGRCHTTIKQFPDWEAMRWCIVTRDPQEWLIDWWHECRKSNDLFGWALGMRYKDIDADLRCLNDVEHLKDVPQRWGVNQWVRIDFSQVFPLYLEQGLSLYHYCHDVITDGVKCETIPLSKLDKWLTANGYPVTHENVGRSITYA